MPAVRVAPLLFCFTLGLFGPACAHLDDSRHGNILSADADEKISDAVAAIHINVATFNNSQKKRRGGGKTNGSTSSVWKVPGGRTHKAMRTQFVSTRNMTKSEARREAEHYLAKQAANELIMQKHGVSLCGNAGCFREQTTAEKSEEEGGGGEEEEERHLDSEQRKKRTRKKKKKKKTDVKWRLSLQKAADGNNYYVLTNEYSESDDAYDNGDILENGNHDILLYVGAGFLLFIVGCFVFQLAMHAQHLQWVKIQRCYLRIIFFAPLYALCAWLSIWRAQYAGYFEIARSTYEGYVLLVFAFMIRYAAEAQPSGGYDDARKSDGGAGVPVAGGADGPAKNREGNNDDDDDNDCDCSDNGEAGGFQSYPSFPSSVDHREAPARFYLCPCACSAICDFEDRNFGLQFYMFLVYQFCVIKPVVTVVAKLLEDEHRIIQQDMYLKTTVIFSVTVALIGIINIYMNLKEKCEILNPGSKIGLLKGVVFFTVWQEVIFHILISEGVIESVYCRVTCDSGDGNSGGGGGSGQCPSVCRPDVPRSGVRSVAMLVVLEMTVLAVCNLWVFSHKDQILSMGGKSARKTMQKHPKIEEKIGRIRGEKESSSSSCLCSSTSSSLPSRMCWLLVSVLNVFDFSDDEDVMNL